MIFEGFESNLTSEIARLEKLSRPVALLDMPELNEALDKRVFHTMPEGNIGRIQEYGDMSKKSDIKNDLDAVGQLSGIPPIAPHPTYEPIPGTGLAKVTDIFGNTRICDPNTVDIFSGLPQVVPDYLAEPPKNGKDVSTESGNIHFYSRDQWKLDNARQIEAVRDAAVEHYKDAKARGNYEEMLKWEAEANKQQGRLFSVLGISAYTLTPKAPGIV